MGSGDIPTGTPSSYFAGLFLLLSYMVSHWEAEVAVIWGAPVLFTVAVAVVGFLIWGAFRYRHGRRLDEIPILQRELTAKDGDLRRREEEIKKLTELLKEATEQKLIEPTKSTVKIYNTPSSPSEIIHPSPNGPLWRWDSTNGALGPFCPNHQQQRLGLKSEYGSGIRLKDLEKEHLSFNWFTCPLDDSENFKFLKQHADHVHQLRTQATDRFRSGYGQKDYVTSWSGVLEIKCLNPEVRWREANGRDFHSLANELPYGADLFLAIQVDITANPTRLVESISLNLAGKLIDEWDWAPKLINKQEFFLYFKLRAPIAFGKQTAFFIAKGLGPDATLMEKRFESFEVIIAGSIPDLQKFSGTLHQEITNLKSKTEDKNLTTQPPTENPDKPFIIEIPAHELRWRTPDETEDHLCEPNTPVPNNASLALCVAAKIKSPPDRFVEEIGLEFIDQFLPSKEEKTERLSPTNKILCFDISSYTPPGEHRARLTARTSWNGGGIKEEKSSPFTVLIPYRSRKDTD